MHEKDIRPFFHRKWASTNEKKGKFEREIGKLEQNFYRKCSDKNYFSLEHLREKNKTNKEKQSSNDEFLGHREKRSGGELKSPNNPGHRMRHIVRNVEQWTAEHLEGCSNQKKVIQRWQKFAGKWEGEISRNPIFQEQFKIEKDFSRSNHGQGRQCGLVYPEVGLHGTPLMLYDASVDESNGWDDLAFSTEDYLKNNIHSMVPYEGK